MKRLKVLLFCAILLSALSGVAAQNPEWSWAKSAGGRAWDKGFAIATDSSGNTYVTGNFGNGQHQTINPAFFGDITLDHLGDYDVFVGKLDANGNWLWVKRVGDQGYERCYSIAVDSAGNVYITGLFSGGVNFGDINLISSGWNGIFVAKLDTDGNWLWARRAGGTTGSAVSYCIAVDSFGNVYLSGNFRGNTAAFGTTTLVSSNYSYSDIFVAKLDTDGIWLWAIRAGGSREDIGQGIAVDSADNIYLTGYFKETVVFGNTTLTSTGSEEIFVAKLDTDGNWLWAKRAGGVGDNDSRGIAVDSADSVYITGRFQTTAHFGDTILTQISGNWDIFVAKLDTNGNWAWAKRAGGSGIDEGRSIAVDSAANVYLTGSLGFSWGGPADFGSTIITCGGTSDGQWDIFVAKLDSAGNWLWADRAGGTRDDMGQGIAVDSSGNIYLTGYYTGTGTFGDDTLTSFTEIYDDIFVAKLSSASAPTPAPVVTIVRSGNNVVLSWNAIPGANGYSVESSNDPYAGFSLLGSTLPGVTIFSTTATPAKKFFRVIALP